MLHACVSHAVCSASGDCSTAHEGGIASPQLSVGDRDAVGRQHHVARAHHAGVFNCGWRWGLRVEALRAQLAHPLYLVAIDVTDLSDKSLVGIRAGTVMKLVWFCSESVLKRF